MKPGLGKLLSFLAFYRQALQKVKILVQYKILGYIIKGFMSYCMEKRFHFPVALDLFFSRM